jgi:hypothetical protein
VVLRLWGESGRASDGIEPATTAAAHRASTTATTRCPALVAATVRDLPNRSSRSGHIAAGAERSPTAAGHDVAAPSAAKPDSAMAG